jgi:hypothetical protein
MYISRKYYSKDDLVWIIISGLIITGGVIIFGLALIAELQIYFMRKADNAVDNLIVALDSNQPFIKGFAGRELNKIGDPLLLDLIPACGGWAISTIGYQASQMGPHSLVLVARDGKAYKSWTYKFLAEWGPSSREAADVQLVACVKEGETNIETCRYQYGSSRKRIQKKLEIEIRETATGKLVAKQTFVGSMPKNCPSSVSPGSGSKNITGGNVLEVNVKRWLADFYE